MHRAIGIEHIAQRSQPGVRIGQVVQDAGAYDLVETAIELTRTLDRQLQHAQVVEPILVLELLGATHAGGAEIDAGDLCLGPAQGMLGRLRGTASGDQDRVIFAVRQSGLKQKVIGAAARRVPPAITIRIQTLDRPRIRIALVEFLDFHGHVRITSARVVRR